MAILSSDIYQIQEFLEEVKQSHIDSQDSNPLILGIFGYLGDVFSTQIQNSVIMSSQWLDEIFPIRANLEKSLLSHAMMAGITELNATPSAMSMLIGIREYDLLNNMKIDTLNKYVFLLDRDTPIYLGDYEFHLEYDVKIYLQKDTDGNNLYVAQYDMDDSRISITTNPYLIPPVKTKYENEDFIFIRATIRQVEYSEYTTKIISNNEVENKTFEFTFENQLADFTITITPQNGNSFKLLPIYENSYTDTTNSYCYYSYINSNTIRVKFINSIYKPSINDQIDVKIITTNGQNGNFTYTNYVMIEPKSNKVTYKDLALLGKPVTDSNGGEDKLSKNDLKRIIPKELLSRGSITCTKDLDNYFNMLNDNYNKLKFLKKVDNQFERTYYSFILLKDDKENIIPTNTINLKLLLTDFDSIGERYVLRPGNALEYDYDLKRAVKIDNSYLTTTLINQKETEGFLYSSPFTIVITKSPNIVSYYLTTFNRKYNLNFIQIEHLPFLQFIATTVSWKRDIAIDRDYYKMDIEITQNIDEDYQLVEVDSDGYITSSKIKCFAVLYNQDGDPYRYTEATAIYYDSSSKTYKFRFKIQTNDDITTDSNINITNMYDIGTTNIVNGYFNATQCKMKVYVVADLSTSYNNRGSLDSIVPGLTNYTLCNIYEVENGIDFFINFSHIISSVVRPKQDDITQDYYYTIDNVPVVKYSYLLDSDRVKYIVNYITDKKNYIDYALESLENSFGIDFKFFNTYGESKISRIGRSGLLDRVNISLKFAIKFSNNTNNDTYIDLIKKEIKSYIEDIEDMSDIYISDIIVHLKETFSIISFIEFLGINNYDAQYQSILKDQSESAYVPEFININSTNINYTPDIDITIL